MITRSTKSTAVFSVLFFGAACLLVVGATMEVRRLGDALEEQVSLVANNEALQAKAQESEEVIEATTKTRQQLNDFVLTEDETINFLAEIETAAQNQGVQLVTKALTLSGEADGDFRSLTASFSFAAQKDAAFRLISMFENLPYESTVTSLSYTETETRLEGEISVVLSIATHDQ